MSTLALYRELVPAHQEIGSSVIEAALASAVTRHTASEWGAAYNEAMCWFAAHQLETTLMSSEAPGALVEVSESRGEGEKRYSKRRSFAPPTSSPADEALTTTTYGRSYLQIRNSRAASAPFFLA